MCCGAVDTDDPGPAGTRDRVGDQPGAVVDVDDGHLLTLEQTGRVEQVLVDRDRSDVVQIGLSHRGAMDL